MEQFEEVVDEMRARCQAVVGADEKITRNIACLAEAEMVSISYVRHR